MDPRQILLASLASRDGKGYWHCPIGKPDLRQFLLAGFLRSRVTSPDSIGPDSIVDATRKRARNG